MVKAASVQLLQWKDGYKRSFSQTFLITFRILSHLELNSECQEVYVKLSRKF